MTEQLSDLQVQYGDFCERLRPDVPSYPSQRQLQVTPQHDGSPHVEIIGNSLHFVVTERGAELERRVASDEDTLLYWFMSSVTFSIACDFEVSHRISGQDSRRELFRKHVELLERLNPDWATRKSSEYSDVLRPHPFVDEA